MHQHVIYKQSGALIEISTFEKKPFGQSKIRIRPAEGESRIHRKRRQDNIARIRSICLRRVYAALAIYGRPLFVTLTLEGDSSDAARANRAVTRFQKRLRARYLGAHALLVPELSPRGRIHFHGLLFNVPSALGDIRTGRRVIAYGRERTTRELQHVWGEGFVDVTQTDGSRKLAGYISKYITKAGGEAMFGAMRMIRVTHGFPNTFVARGTLAKHLARSFQDKKPERTWSSTPEHQLTKFLGAFTKNTYTVSDEDAARGPVVDEELLRSEL